MGVDVNFYDIWNEKRTKIPPGKYNLIGLKGHRAGIWLEGQGGYGRSNKIVLWFKVYDGPYQGALLPAFIPINENGKVPQGSKYYHFWVIANGLRRPIRNRLKEMPISKFENKLFRGEVVDVKPKYKNGETMPELFHYSRVDMLYELLVGNPDS